MAKKCKVTINGITVSVQENSTVMEAAAVAKVKIPSLCFLKEINEIGACRVCVVEVEGVRNLVTACVFPVKDGMVVRTNTKRVTDARRTTVELLLSNHKKQCLSCTRSGNCELQKLAQELGCNELNFVGAATATTIDRSTSYLVRDNSKCVLCKRCVAVCKHNQSVAVIGANDRGFDTHIGCAFDDNLANIPCVACGQCITHCPTGALTEKDDIDLVQRALADPTKRVVVAPAPSVRAAIGEEFGMKIGTNCQGKLAAALHMMGFDDVFDIDFGADLTIMEEAHEFLQRFSHGGVLPMITSCSPGWIKFVEHYYPQFIPNLSTCKSPQQMFGAVVKTYYAQKLNIKPQDIFMVGVMPCTAKKFERMRDQQSAAGVPDIDAVLTTRELARFMKKVGINFTELKDQTFDTPLGIASGAGLIFGATGGVMEAALRTAVEVITKKPLQNLDFTNVRGTDGIKEAEYNVAGKTIRVAVVSGLANAKQVLDGIIENTRHYDFVEVMCCPGGCVAGGGQPIQPASVLNTVNIRQLRAKALYDGDKKMELRKSHENPAIKELYAEFLGEPNGHKAHEILHTGYVARKK